ncbi:programmed cell death 6 [Fusarium longipes]|uniref:Programmed cell death 6 n=1 Tax=Fusarium longipes TaxID=694270 RepID=A0A395SPG1_9HYPO|nr:programmed cell death 6 [Fusarium longipes]
MAYNRPYDEDALPRFAEPEPKPGQARTPAPQQHHAPPPQQQQHYSSQQQHYAPQQQQQQQYQHQQPRYDKPLPTHRDARSHSLGQGPASHGYMSPPPNTGGARPQPHNRPAANSRPPPSPALDGGNSDPSLLPLFRAVDKDGTGHLSERELSAALVNGDWTAFDPHTVRMMIRMFDSDRSGTIGFEEFCGLWSFLASWRTLFDRFDVDRSGNISLSEFNNALVAFRYRLSPQFVELLFNTYDKRNEGVMSFDLFVQSCISLKRMTDVFKKYDDDRDGYITLSFEDFLTEILKQLK